MKLTGLSASLIVVMLLAGCDKGESSSGEAASGSNVITITGNDQMRFDKTQFTVHSGDKVQIIFENVGKLPVTTMGHDLVILTLGTDYKSFANDVQAAEKTEGGGHIPDPLLTKVIAHTNILGPGEKQKIEFVAPAVGTYDYLCTFPGHFVFMHGEMIVK